MRHLPSGFFRILPAFLVLGLLACNGDNDPSGPVVFPVVSVEIYPAPDTLSPGDTLRLGAVARGKDGILIANTIIAWSTLTPSIATVDTTGLVTAVAPGDASIVAAMEGISDTLRLHVLGQPQETCGNDAGNGATVTAGPSGPNPAHGDNDTMFRGFLVDPADADVLYLGTERNGILRSADGGATWTRQRQGLRWNDVGYPEIWSLALDPADRTKLLAATTDSPGPFTGNYPSANAGLYRSENSGQTWARSNCGLPHAKTSFVLFVPGGAGRTVVASVQAGAPSFPNPPAAYYAGGLFRSTDGGSNWTRAAAPAAADSMEYWQILSRGSKLVTFAFRDADISKNVGFLQSLDGGVTWSPFASAARAKRYYTWTASASGDTMLAAQPDGFVIDRSLDGGATWAPLTMDGMHGAISRVALSPADSRRVLYSTGQNALLLSTDALGARTVVLNTPETIQAIEFAPSRPQTVYAVTRGYLVYRSTDAGATWTLRRNLRADVLNAP
jgi:photosystem II stability/assembly factor-like uncharacterized protein